MAVWDTISRSLDRFDASSFIDLMSIAVLIYLGLLLLRGTTAMSLLRGIMIVVVAAVILAQLLNLTVLDWLLRNSFPALLIAIPIVFQSEIRRFLERVGRTSRWPWPGRALFEGVVDTIADSSVQLAEKQHGAIIVVERETGLEEYLEAGVKLDAAVSVQLIKSIFYPNSALHDGAVIVREDRVVAASCTLPLSDRIDAGFHGTRHRAALGVTERTDAVAVVVSEETGQVSIAANGRIISNLDGPRVRGILRSLLLPSLEMDRPAGRRLPRLSR
ncbi:MAG: TIGR00159 family protein [Chloroflexi bacterium]|nr:MAG: TIGR00159 family protein [Chloroflexota bacterium]